MTRIREEEEEVGTLAVLERDLAIGGMSVCLSVRHTLVMRQN